MRSLLTAATVLVLSFAGPALAQDSAEPEGESARPNATEVERPAPRTSPENARVAAALRERENLRPWHILFGSLTGLATYTTTLLGFLHFNDRYGWDGNPANTGCAQGNPILGTELCTGPPWPHLIAASADVAFFATAFTLALLMPDPLHASEGSSDFAVRLTVHKTLRWVLLGLMVAQIALGAVSASLDTDFGTRRAVAATHVALGTVTWATMTTQGILGSSMAW